MLVSMTGQGIATLPCSLPGVGDRMHVVAEVRSVNHRFLKIHTRLDDALSRLEPEVESLVRTRIRRGSLQVQMRLEGEAGEPSYRINEEVLARYCQQALKVSLEIRHPIELSHCLALPGVISGGQKVWEVDSPQMEAARKTLLLAIDQLQQMRSREGEWLQTQLDQSLQQLDQRLVAIVAQAPQVAQEYRDRLARKVKQALADQGMHGEPADIVREVAIFSDRVDIQEECVRLRGHLAQFRQAVSEPESQGRKLDFVIQEMGREVNTIGSKANDALIAREVVEMKTLLEQMREQIQNIE
jgi:uncharacterized protein (TIGR00255 family)